MTRQTKPSKSDAIRRAVAADGFAFIGAWEPSLTTSDVACRVGEVLRLGKNSDAHKIVPNRSNTPNTYSGMYGFGEFPLHTDMAHWRDPPRYLMLRCIRGYASVATTAIDGVKIVAQLGESILARALIKPRRPNGGAMHLFALYRAARLGVEPLLRWDESFIVPASPAGAAAIALVHGALSQIGRVKFPLCEAGDTLILDNWRMLHGRSSVGSVESDRIIERAYLRRLI